MMYKKNPLLPLLATVVIVLTSCGSIPKDAFKLTPELLQKRELKTRKYEGISEVDILSASAGVLQDLGFNIDESESKLGLIVGSKERDATEIGQEVWWWTKVLLTYGYSWLLGDETDDYQKFKASVVIRPISKDNDKIHYVSVTFQRIVWDTADKISKQETLDAPEIYREFFDRLSKSVFLEGQKI
ncbi:MAG: hypothetical protein OXG87_01030 [Gemmatimonadetes bacterium]|nr:hypothetical protein [Gemmatimonadota bacterium]